MKNSEQLLADDHDELNKLLNALVTAIDQNDFVTTFARLDLFWAGLAMHIRAENLRLFPALLKALEDNPGAQKSRDLEMVVRQAINRLHSDHDFFMSELAAGVKIMRESMLISTREAEKTVDQVRQIVVAVNKRLESHNELEEELVYRLAAKLLSTDEQSELAASIRSELENLPPRFTTM